jgi:leucyl-tRNA synthetase
MNEYNFKEIEKKWQKVWGKDPQKAIDFDSKPKHYHLVEFPYPSGEGLHVGHCMGYGASDAYCRMKRMQGFNVLFPIGWDAFGLPTENFAIKNKVKPQDATKKNIDNYRNQMKSLGLSFDFDREVNTTDPNYYKWTQWIFLQFYKYAIIDGKLIEVKNDDKTTPRLAYQAEMPVNWCPSCKINLANEEVINGKCERCGTETSKRMQKQWMLRITSYAEKLIDGLKDIDYLNKIKQQQINWIGRSEGSKIRFEVKTQNSKVKTNEIKELSIEVFTTRADTLFGCTYVVLSPEHKLIKNLELRIKNYDEVKKYIEESKKKTDIQRSELEKEKTGVKLDGIKAINPINNEEIDVFVADYVLSSYGTGAVMAVPAHDERDFEFSKKYGIEIKPTVIKSSVPYKSYLMGAENISDDDLSKIGINIVDKTETGSRKLEIPKKSIGKYEELISKKLSSGFWNEYIGDKIMFIFKHKDNKTEKLEYNHDNIDKINSLTADFSDDKSGKTIIDDWLDIGADGFYKDYLLSTDYGILINSGEFDRLSSEEAKKKITEKLKSISAGDFSVNYKLRDWIFSRQHYWGEPIPIIHCQKCGTVPVEEDQLPIVLPDVDNYEPTDTGKSPLDNIDSWVNVKCPKCGGSAKRETDTMPNWAGSSWYYLRYTDPTDDRELASTDKLKYWMPVDLYNGGMEHTTLHLLYSRFWHKFLFDLNVVPTSEPYKKRIAHGIILGPDNQKMSKSKGNVINPDEMIDKFGADTLRAYIMFIGPYDQESSWSMDGIKGVHRFINRLWKIQSLVTDKNDDKNLLIKLNLTIKNVTKDLERFNMNTVVSKLMELNNEIQKIRSISRDSMQKYLLILYPIVPFITEELWETLKFDGSVSESNWPKIDEDYIKYDKVTLAIQINGKTKTTIEIDADLQKDDTVTLCKENELIKKHLESKNIKNIIYVPGQIVNFVLE